MNVSETAALERVARVLAGMRLSANGEGHELSAGQDVDDTWRDFLGGATAVLKTLREPDAAMTAVGDLAVWCRMINAALGDHAHSAPAAPQDVYQKPLG